MWLIPKGFTRVNNLVQITMWLTPKEWSCFACERNLVNGSATFRAVCILQIFYVYNALHGATLANRSHFQYVSRSRLRVIQIGVKACINVDLYDELFFTCITEKHFLIPLRIFLTVVQWSTPGSLLYPLAKLMVTRSATQHSVLYRTYDWGIGNDFSFSFYFLSWSGFESLLNFTPCNTGKNSFFDCSVLNYFKILSRYVLIEKYIKCLDVYL